MLNAVVGWLATALVVLSYFTRRPAMLRRVQGVAACVWCGYGILIHSQPVIVANIIVAAVATMSSFRSAVRPPAGSPAG